MIQIQDLILKHPDVIDSPIIADTLLIKDEYTCEHFYLFLFDIHLQY